jgi:predicted amidohydrolase
MKLRVATCKFPIGSDVRNNLEYVARQIRTARDRGADVAHFPEACLSGYAGADFASHEGFDWSFLEECAREVFGLARESRIWVVLGSAHRLTAPHKPHNSLYIIDDRGRIVDRYDKMFCAGDLSEETGDLAHYSPGVHFSVFTIKGVRCGALICHDYRYPELYREYKRRGVQLMLHSYHAGNIPPERFEAMRDSVGERFRRLNPGSTIPGITMPATMVAEAANNHVWISCPNSSSRESLWPSFFVRPDGVVTGRLRRHTADVLVSEVDTDEQIYDSTVDWRDWAMDGVLHSGTPVRDKKSDERTRL